MKYYYLLLLICFSLPLSSFGQTGYYPGFVLTNKSDTLKGYIDHKNRENYPRAISFKPDAQNQAQKLTIKDTICFSIYVGSPMAYPINLNIYYKP